MTSQKPKAPEPIAIVGTGFRFPGGASTPSKLWELLHSPKDVLAPIPATRFNADGFYHPDGEYGGHSNVRNSYTLSEDYAAWDAGFFKIAVGEASAIDPQQRLLMECVYEALESGGHSIQRLRRSDTAVYVGLVNEEYSDIHYRELNTTPRYFSTGTGRSIASNRVSYFFDWRGPCMTIDTACSSSLVAVHQAIQAIRSGVSKVAVAAGVNLLLGPEPYIVESSFHMLSPTGRCRMWDASADGYGRGDGIAAVVLKSLSQAIADGDRIESVIRETGINQDGATSGITVPNPSAQVALIQETYRRAGLDLTKARDRPQFFECHGTGTPAGDPLEAQAVQSSLGRLVAAPGSGGPLYVGSVKTVIGHTEATAGIAGLIKVSLAIQHRLIPPNMLFEMLNPAIEPLYRGLQVPVENIPWPETGASPRRASVNSFGFGGTNAHAIVESYQPPKMDGAASDTQESVPLPFVFSAQSKASLKRMLAKFADFLLPGRVPRDLTDHDLAFTLNSRRSLLSCRAVFAARGVQHLGNQVRDAIQDQEWQPAATVSESKDGEPAPRILGVFAGQGAQWAGMARRAIRDIPFVRERFAELEGYLQDLPEEDVPAWSLRDELSKVEGSNLHLAQFSQPLCTALQLVQVDLLAAAGVKFSVVVGHSSGEIAAAYTAGLLSARDAMVVAYYRGLHSSRLANKNSKAGAMMAAGIDFAEACRLVGSEQFKGRIAVAAHNSPTSVTLSGDEDAILEAKELLASQGKFARLLRVDQAYHSQHMQPCLAPYIASLRRAGVGSMQPSSCGSRSTKWYSSVHKDGDAHRIMTAVDCEYWAANMAQTVLFAGAVGSTLTADPAAAQEQPFTVAVGIGPHGALRGPFEDIIGSVSSTRLRIPYIDVLARNQDDSISLMQCIGNLLAHGAVDSMDVGRFQAMIYHLESKGRRLTPAANLPTYPWDHSRTFWHESRRSRALRTRSKPAHPLLGTLSPDSSATDLAWHNLLRLADLPWLRGHRLQGQTIYPAAAYLAGTIDAALHVAAEMQRTVKTIEFRDVWIGKAIAFDDDSASGVEMYTTLTIKQDGPGGVLGASEVLEAGFRVRSTVFGTASTDAPLNCSGTILISLLDRDEMKPALPLLSPQKQPPALLVPVNDEEFYRELSHIGYQYTDCFRALASARRKLGYAQATLNLPVSQQLHRSERGFLLHPGPLDALFQIILLAYACPGDGRLWSLHVPIAIDRIVMDVSEIRKADSSSSTSYTIEAAVDRDPSFSGRPQSGLGGDVGIFTRDGGVGLVWAEGVCLAPLATASADDDVQMFLEPVDGPVFPDCALAMSSPADKTVARATEDENKLGWLLDRIAYFYLERLTEEIKPEQEAKAKWHFQKLMNYARHVCREAAAGRQPYVQVEFLQDTYEEIIKLMDQHMDIIDVQLMRAVGENLAAAVRGETVILQHMMQDGMLDRSYEETLGVKPFSDFLSRVIEQILFIYPEASILEIGAGTGGATKGILGRNPDNFGHYTFTDISSGFFEKAESVFATFVEGGRMSFRVLNIERDPTEQGFAEHSYDLVLASFVLHATADLERTLRNAHRLLKPGGYLVLLEMTSNDTLRLGLTMGGLEGWWLGAETGRPWSPCVSTREWHALLKATGFTGVENNTPELDPLAWPYGVLVSRALDPRVTLLLEPSSRPLVEPFEIQVLLIIAGSSPQNVSLARELQGILQPFSQSQVVVTDGMAGFSRQQAHRKRHSHPDGARKSGQDDDRANDLTVLYLADLNEEPLLQGITPDGFQGLKELFNLSPRHLLWLTHGARDSQNPYAVASIGLGRALMMEYRQVDMQFMDFPTPVPDAKVVRDHLLRLVILSAIEKEDSALLWSREPEISVDRQGRCWASRIKPHRHFNNGYNSARRTITEPPNPVEEFEVYEEWSEGDESVSRLLVRTQAIPQSLQESVPHKIKPLYSVPIAPRPGGGTWNLTAGLLIKSAQTADQGMVVVLSDRLGSVITALSEPVSISTKVTPVLMHEIGAHLFASLIMNEVKRQSQLMRHGYQQKSKKVFLILEPGASLARRLSQTAAASDSWTVVCVTTCRAKLASAPESFVFVDVNSSSSVKGRALNLSSSSRVIGIFICSDPATRVPGEQTLAASLRGSLPELSRTRTWLASDLLQDADDVHVAQDNEAGLAPQLLLASVLRDAVASAQESSALIKEGHVDVELLSLQEYVQGARGTTAREVSVIDFSAGWSAPLTITARPLDGIQPLLKGDGTYLLLGLGGKGGLGSSLAEYMVRLGARYIVLTSRNPGVEEALTLNYAKQGVQIQGMANDITDESALRKLIRDIDASPDWPPIAGVANGAMVLADVSLQNMEYDQMVRVLRPKVLGSILLDKIFETVPLDFFILISSLSCVLGNRGQANYDAANMFLVGLAAQRRSRGLAASVVDIGAVMGTGYMARAVKEQTLKQMVGAGFAKMSERDFYMAFAHAILAGRPEQRHGSYEVITGLNVPQPTDEFQPDWVTNPRFSHMISRSRAVTGRKTQESTSGRQAEKTRDLLKRARTADDLSRIVSTAVVKKTMHMLQVSDEMATDHDAFLRRSTSSLGVDSLVAVELRTWVFREFEVDIPVFKILADTSFGDIVNFILAVFPESLVPCFDRDSDNDAVPASALESMRERPSNKMNGKDASKQPTKDSLLNFSSPSGTPVSTPKLTPVASPDNSSERDPGEEDSKQDRVDRESSGSPTQDSPTGARFERVVAMSYGQRRFWLMSNLGPAPTICNVVNDIEIRAELDTGSLARAVCSLGERHEALRTAFISNPTSEVPDQVVLKQSPLRLQTIKLQTLNEVDDIYHDLHRSDYNLETGELVKMVLVSLSPGLHHLLIGYHHINMDSFSMSVLMRELLELYAGKSLDPPALQQSDLGVYERKLLQGGRWSKELVYWSNLFAGAPSLFDPLPILHVSPSSTSRVRPERIAYKSHVQSRRVSADTAKSLRSLCRSAGVTPFHVYTVVLQVLVSRLGQLEHVTMAMGHANRENLDLPGEDGAVGNFLNMVLLRLRTPSRGRSIHSFLSETRAVVLEAMANASVPIELVMEQIGVPKTSSYSPLFQIFIDYKRVQEKLPFPGGGTVQGTRYLLSETPYDIMLDIIDTAAGDALLQMHAQDGIYTPEETTRLLELYSTLLDSFSQADGETIIGDVRMAAADQVKAALRLGEILELKHQSILHSIDLTARSLQDVEALADTSNNSLSWAELISKSTALGHELRRLGVGPGSRVGIFQEPTVDWVVTMLGVWRAGASFVPMDLGQGLPRLARIARAANLAAVVAHPETVALVGELGRDPQNCVVDITELHISCPVSTSEASGVQIKSEDEAVVLFTSGTTGEPKGISIPHRVILTGIKGMVQRWPDLNSTPLTVLQHTSLNFDVSAWVALLGLACGGKTIVASRDIRGDPRALTRVIIQRQVNLSVATPSEAIGWLQSFDPGEVATCKWRWLVAVGEPIPITFLRQLHLHGKASLRVINAYGPTETWMPLAYEIPHHGSKTVAEVDRLWPVPIGGLMPNYSVRVVDSNGHVLPPGMPGQLVIGGCGIALGYVGSSAPHDRFIPDPNPVQAHLASGWRRVHLTGDYGYMTEDGVFYSLGRIQGDTQIKLRGQRLDLRDVEQAIVENAGGSVLEVVVSVRRIDGQPLDRAALASDSTSKMLVAHAVVAPSWASDSAEFLRSLVQGLPLPDYMRPSVIVPVESLPLTMNGKQDRTTISQWPVILASRGVRDSPPEFESAQVRIAQPNNRGLETMAEIWRQALASSATGLDVSEPLDPEVDFFHIGGNSLLLTRVQRSIRVNHGVDVPLRQLFHNTKLARMARLLRPESDLSDDTIDWNTETRPIPELNLALQVAKISPVDEAASTDATRGLVVVLTGAAGFLGCHLVQSLIQHPAFAEVHCVAVRSRLQRLVPLQDAARAAGKKLHVHLGDLCQPGLGLTDARSVFSLADVIIHNAADTSFLKSYATLRVPNVDSLKTLARLSLTHRTIAPPMNSPRRSPAHLHFISTAGVATYVGRDLAEEPLGRPPPAHVTEGYLLTKWAGEQWLEHAAAASGGLLRATVHRVASLVGPGAPVLDIVSSVVRHSLAVGAVPTLAGYRGQIQFVPVEEVARGIVGAAALEADGAGVRYLNHCGEADAAVDLGDLGSYCKRSLGQDGSLPVVEDEEWIRKAEVVGFPPLLGSYLRADTLGGKRTEFKILLKR
ncbi:uncharacterized protein PgNI_10061 [Pyricularia grisea]|uniref:Polyketide synthase n=1 Tax=Pyricularia grisea TaxID=148305 RepID=A0A6P8ARW5_PYRGI|nr:uncharacterized protein PgNI_10061 [Pyricularia grisea]TLD04871.1 hypothetical protein PgNI_10061 [Pyricularia grisea]